MLPPGQKSFNVTDLVVQIADCITCMGKEGTLAADWSGGMPALCTAVWCSLARGMAGFAMLVYR